MPVISCGGMRYQQSWSSGKDPIGENSQKNVEATIYRALDLGINHFETARAYGTSEEQMGRILPKLPRDEIIVQTKIGPIADVARFEKVFEKSKSLINMDYLDIFSFHGINNDQSFEYAMRCLEPLRRWQKEGRIRHVGFSTHGPMESIVKTIRSGEFDSVNLHYFFIWQDNLPAVQAARDEDMGVFIISPNDKGGALYRPSEKLMRLTAPFHPMVFNGLFCLSHPEVHTISCGAARPGDFDTHMETAENLDGAEALIAPIIERLETELAKTLGESWARSWDEGLPVWHDTPGEINLPWVLRLRNLAIAYDMTEFAKSRYNMLGSNNPFFPGNQAKDMDGIDWAKCLSKSPHAEAIPGALSEAHALLHGEQQKPLSLG